MLSLPTEIVLDIVCWEPELSYHVNKDLFDLVCSKCNKDQLFSLLCLSLSSSIHIKIVTKHINQVTDWQRSILRQKLIYQGNPTTIGYLIDMFQLRLDNFLPYMPDIIRKGKFHNAIFIGKLLERNFELRYYLPSDLQGYRKFLKYWLIHVNSNHLDQIFEYLEFTINPEQVQAILEAIESINITIYSVENVFTICYRLDRIDLLERFLPLLDKSKVKEYFEDNNRNNIINWIVINQSIDAFEYMRNIMYLNNSFSYNDILTLCIENDLIELARHICSYNYISPTECYSIVVEWKNFQINNGTYLYLLEFTYEDLISAANEGYLQAIIELYNLETKSSTILQVLINNIGYLPTPAVDYILNNIPVIKKTKKLINKILNMTLVCNETFKYIIDRLSVSTFDLESILIARLSSKGPNRKENIRTLLQIIISRVDCDTSILNDFQIRKFLLE